MKITLTILCLPFYLSTAAIGQEMAAGHLEFFEKEIRPALVKHCYECHSKDGDKIKGGLLLDSQKGIFQGGNTGPAVAPGDLNESLLFAAIGYEDDDFEMPPKYKLPDSVIADFKRWIELGAPWPVEQSEKPARSASYTNTIDIEKGRAEHWAYQQPAITSEKPSDLGDSRIDSYIHAGLAEKEMTPAEKADATTLIRRISYDLTGLPPSPKMVREFTLDFKNQPERAIERAVDTLLASPQYGERWGRHWMDVARYAESAGKESNAAFPYAWRYRDWVIDSFNADKPFDEMIREQIAGDLLEDEPGEKTIATGFLALGVKGLIERNVRQYRFDVADEQIDTTTRAFLATTAACSRCHDHKFDPIPMSDYYSLAGIFLSSDTHYGTPESGQNAHPETLINLPESYRKEDASLPLARLIDQEFQLALITEKREQTRTDLRAARRAGNNEEANRLQLQLPALNNQYGLSSAQSSRYDDDGNLIPRAMGLSDSEEPFDSQILIRGEEGNTTQQRAPRGFLQVVKTNDEQQISADQSGRLQLANWISSPDNPLTARVYVNRVWLWLFGEGLVSSVDNFGTTGEKPMNPELLDYLALRLIELDWSTKRLIKEIMMSDTYQMSSNFREDYYEIDPNNRLHWRANKRRLDAESIRDSVLAVSGQLDLARPEGSILSDIGPGFIGRNISEAQLNKSVTYRSVYLPIVRDLIPEVLDNFDFADPAQIVGKREVTTVPSQALYLMNSDFALSGGQKMARYLRQELEAYGAQLIRTAYLLTYSRSPTESEVEKTTDYLQTSTQIAIRNGKSKAEAREVALSTFCQALLSSAEFSSIN